MLCIVQLAGAVSEDDTKKSLWSSSAKVGGGSSSFFAETLQRLESVTKMSRPMAVRMMKIAIRYSVLATSVVKLDIVQ